MLDPTPVSLQTSAAMVGEVSRLSAVVSAAV